VQIIVGICGFAASKKRIFSSKLGIIEVQKTFYGFPRETTFERWRNEAPESMEFSLKAPMLLTHEPSSPIYRKSKFKLTEGEKEYFGTFKLNEKSEKIILRTFKIAKILNARHLVFQTPKSFNSTQKNIEIAKNFLSYVKKKFYGKVCWEPRGWDPSIADGLCKSLNIIEITDPFARLPSHPQDVYYFRLHGSPPGERMYRYTYTDNDLKELYETITTLSFRTCYVLFNNVAMFNDALRFISILGKK